MTRDPLMALYGPELTKSPLQTTPNFEAIKARLESELPQVLSLTREELAAILRIHPKTLANDAAPRGAGRYPPHVCDGGKALYRRHIVIEYLAKNEWDSLMRHVHRSM